MDERVAAWAKSGAMALTGRAGGTPLGPPAPLVDRLAAFGAVLHDFGGRQLPDPIDLLSERAELLQLTRNGDISCGGATRLLRSRDGWIAVAMARPDDVVAIPAWLELDRDPIEPWLAIAEAASSRAGSELVERGRLLGLPVCVLGEQQYSTVMGKPPFDNLPFRARAFGTREPVRERAPVVVDLSSLWAGPLCGRLLHLADMRVVKVESTARPDGARQGSPSFFELLNGGKEHVALDLRRNEGVHELQRLLANADIVIEASRPRALQQLGIDADAYLSAPRGPTAWISITGYGRDGDGADRVAFGDDAAIAGGLVVWDDRGPCFCADAVADPVTGVVAAAAALAALASDRRWLIDVAMATVAADLAGPTLPVSPTTEAASPP